MKILFVNNVTTFLSKYRHYSEIDMQKLKYGLEGLYLTLSKTIIIIVLALLLNMLKEVISIIFFFNIIRYFGFGVHASKSSQCLFFSIVSFILLPYIFFKVNISNLSIIIISIICFINLLLFAPADTIKRPFKNKRKKLIRKILTLVIALIYIFIAIYIKNIIITKIILISLIIESIIVNPIAYILLKQPFNNSKNV